MEGKPWNNSWLRFNTYRCALICAWWGPERVVGAALEEHCLIAGLVPTPGRRTILSQRVPRPPRSSGHPGSFPSWILRGNSHPAYFRFIHGLFIYSCPSTDCPVILIFWPMPETPSSSSSSSLERHWSPSSKLSRVQSAILSRDGLLAKADSCIGARMPHFSRVTVTKRHFRAWREDLRAQFWKESTGSSLQAPQKNPAPLVFKLDCSKWRHCARRQ